MTPSIREYINPASLFDSQQYGFSQAVSGRSGRWVVLSGQVGWDASMHVPADNSLCGQARLAMDNIRLAMQAAGGDVGDVISLRLYIVADYMPESDCLSDVLLQCFAAGALPATTWVGVPCLSHPDMKIEIEAMAVISDD